MAIGPGLVSFFKTLSPGLYLTKKQLEALQLTRLRRLIGHAYDNVTYYRNLFDSIGFRPQDLKTLADLSLLPVTTRAHLQEVPYHELVSRTARFNKLRMSRTSGATGMPLAVYRTRQESILRQLLTLRAFRLNGLRWNDKVVTISRQPTGARLLWPKTWPQAPLWNIWFFEEPEEIVKILRRLKPTVIYGFATNLAIVADLMLRKNIDDVNPRLVATSSDLLLPSFRRLIFQAFKTDPLDIYNCTEIGDIGWQCQTRRDFHLNADSLLVELLQNGKRVPPGETGEVVVTNLFRYAMPLIRYSPGDLASSAEAPCLCGLGLPVLGRIDGRSNHIVPLPNGRVFVGFSEIMGEFVEVLRYQIIQLSLNMFLIKIVPRTGFSELTRSSIAHALASRLGEGIQIEVRTVDGSEFAGPRKFPTVVPFAPVDLGNRT